MKFRCDITVLYIMILQYLYVFCIIIDNIYVFKIIISVHNFIIYTYIMRKNGDVIIFECVMMM